MQALENQLQEQQQESNKAIMKWQENFSEIETKYSSLEKELRDTTIEKESLAKALITVEQDNKRLEELKAGLEEEKSILIAKLESARSGEERAMKEALELRNELREKTEALLEAQEVLARDDDVVRQWEGT